MNLLNVMVPGFVFLLYLSVENTCALQTFYLASNCEDKTKIINVGDIYSSMNSSGTLKTFSMYNYSPGITCEVRLVPNYFDGIIVSIREVSFYSNSYSLQLKNSDGITSTYYSSALDLSETKYFDSNGEMTVYLTTGTFGLSSNYNGFEITFTSFRSSSTGNSYCPSGGFLCNNGRCVNSVLKCDGHNHCGDRSDQTTCGSTRDDIIRPAATSPGSTIGFICGSIFLVVAVIAGIVHICLKNNRVVTTTTTTHPPPPIQPFGTVLPNMQQYPPPGIQHPPPGTQYPPPGTQYPPPGTHYPPSENYPPPYWTSTAPDGGHQNLAFH